MEPILMIKDHPELVRIEEQYMQREKFLKKQMEEIAKKGKESHEDFWQEVYDYLNNAGIKKKAEKCSYTFRSGVLYEIPKDEAKSFKSFLEQMFD